MGCDIHIHIEVKFRGNWEHYGTPQVSRWYRLFAKMANVRNAEPHDKDYIKPISDPKGMPDDVTTLTAHDNERGSGDWHSHSWLDLDEIVLLEDWLEEQSKQQREIDPSAPWLDLEHTVLHTYLFGNSFAGLRRYPKDYDGDQVADVRFVFWFDN